MSWIRSTPFLEFMKAGGRSGFKCVPIWSLYAIFILVSGSCTSAKEDPLVDRSFLTKQPCAPPCWYRLELDKAGQEDIYT